MYVKFGKSIHVGQAIRQAAKLIDTEGWCTKTYQDQDNNRNRFCVVGALRYSLYGSIDEPYDIENGQPLLMKPEYRQVYEYLAGQLGKEPEEWNDETQGLHKARVVKRLFSLAERWERDNLGE